MTDKSFDQFTKLVSRSTSRRGLLKGAAAAALSGVAMRLRGGNNDAEARARIRMACARLGQPCDTVVGTPGNMICCPGLACDLNGEVLTCCTPEGESCIDNTTCCAGNVCRPNPKGIGNLCLPPGDVGAECLEDADCASGVCDGYSGTCLGDGCGGVCDAYLGPILCGADSRTNSYCACYPIPDGVCGCAAANSCSDTISCCDTSADCGAGELCIIPPVPTSNCGCGGSVGTCVLACDFQGDTYSLIPASIESVGW